MEELLDALDAVFDEAEGWIRLVDADWIADDLKLNLSIHFHDNRDPEIWEITCVGVVEHLLNSSETTTISVSNDSPLLKPFLELDVPITFSENLVPAETLFGIVCSCCIEVMGRSEKIAKYLNGTPTIMGISSSEYGLLGRFPASLAVRILEALKDKPIKAHALTGHQPKRWNGSLHEAYPPLCALELGDSYVVAERFTACRA